MPRDAMWAQIAAARRAARAGATTDAPAHDATVIPLAPRRRSRDRGVRLERAARGRAGARHRDRARAPSRRWRHDVAQSAVARAPIRRRSSRRRRARTPTAVGAHAPDREAPRSPRRASRDVVEPRATRGGRRSSRASGLHGRRRSIEPRRCRRWRRRRRCSPRIAARRTCATRLRCSRRRAGRATSSPARGCSSIRLRGATRRCAHCSPIWS